MNYRYHLTPYSEEGYTQHMITKVLGISQPAANGLIRRNRK